VKLGVCTGGGDCAGLNAVLRSLVLCARRSGDVSIIGIEEGINGLASDPPRHRILFAPGGGGIDEFTIENLLNLGGTFLTTSNAGNPFRDPQAGEPYKKNVARGYKALGLDALIVIGGDGTHCIAAELADAGVRLIGIPKTIDNDYVDSELAVGFTSAVEVASEAILQVNTSGTSHGRVMVVEVMGRNAGYIALNAGIAAGADVILLPERPFSRENLAAHLKTNVLSRKNHALVVCAEGAHARGEALKYRASTSGSRHLGGVGDDVATFIHESLGRATRCTVLGHTQRGSRPVSVDRVLAARFATRAMRLAREKRFGSMVVLKKGEVEVTTYPEPRSRGGSAARCLDPSDPTIVAAQDMGIYCGENP
jgi:6-phosphofructokinase 1